MKNLLTILTILIVAAGCGEEPNNNSMMQNNYTTNQLDLIHKKSGWHEEEIQSSSTCGCFYCLDIYPPSEIEEWIEEGEETIPGKGKTAICPKCGIDAVLPESSDYEMSIEFLKVMNEAYF